MTAFPPAPESPNQKRGTMKRIIAVVATMAAVLLGSIAAATPAQAHATCAYRAVCLHTGSSFSGTEKSWDVGSSGSFCRSLTGSTLNNNVESIYGNYVGFGRRIYYYNGDSCLGTAVFSSTGGEYATLPSSARNVITSFYVTSS